MGTRYDPFCGRPGKRELLHVKGFLLLALFATGLFFYLFSWKMIGPDGIEERLAWTTSNHSYQDIASLEMIPYGLRSESLTQNGPWYSIRFKSGRYIIMSDENEGSTREDLRVMTTYIAHRSGLKWVRRSDAYAP